MQTKKQSLKEAISNVLVGFIISVTASFVIFPICSMKVTPMQNIGATLLFTITSIIRQYVIRRWFNKKENYKYVMNPNNYIIGVDPYKDEEFNTTVLKVHQQLNEIKNDNR